MKKKKKFSKNIKTVLDILQDEVDGNVAGALKKITKDYTMTWVDTGLDGKHLFPTTKKNIKKELEEIYPIRGRQYDIKTIAEGDGVVMVELVESYPASPRHSSSKRSLDTKTKKPISAKALAGRRYRTPLVLVLEMKGGKIRTGRHYLDPTISRKQLSRAQVEKAFKNSKGSVVVIK